MSRGPAPATTSESIRRERSDMTSNTSAFGDSISDLHAARESRLRWTDVRFSAKAAEVCSVEITYGRQYPAIGSSPE